MGGAPDGDGEGGVAAAPASALAGGGSVGAAAAGGLSRRQAASSNTQTGSEERIVVAPDRTGPRAARATFPAQKRRPHVSGTVRRMAAARVAGGAPRLARDHRHPGTHVPRWRWRRLLLGGGRSFALTSFRRGSSSCLAAVLHTRHLPAARSRRVRVP